MHSSDKVAVLGGGSFGTVLANLAASNGFNVSLWVRDSDQALRINSEGANYEVEDITVITKNKKIKAKTLIYKSNNLLSIPPSRRYMKILINAAIKNQLSENYIQKLKRHPSVYYPILSEIYAVRIFFWVRKRSKNINSN